MANIFIAYGPNNQAITCTFTSLANNGQRGSAAIDNTSNLFLDALVQVKVKSGSGTSSTGFVNVYAYGTADNGGDYSDGVGGTDAGVTLTVPPNAKRIGMINVVASSAIYVSSPMSVAQAFGGVLPAKWGIIIENKTGGTLDGSTGSAWYQGIYNQAI